MANVEAKSPENQHVKNQKVFLGVNICLRIVVTGATMAATWVLLTSKQTAIVYSLPFVVKYNYSPAFKFLAFADVIACAFTVLSLLFVIFTGWKGMRPASFFFLFLNDLCMMALILAGCAAATAIGYLGKHGNRHSGWLPICGYVTKFCDRVTITLILSYSSLLCLLVLTVISASKSRRIQG